MDCSFKTYVDNLTIALSVRRDWSGPARVAVWETHKAQGRSAQALCDVRRLLSGVIENLAYEAGEFLPSDWPLIVSLAVRAHFKEQMQTALHNTAGIKDLEDNTATPRSPHLRISHEDPELLTKEPRALKNLEATAPGFIPTAGDRITLARLHNDAPAGHVGSLTRRLVKRVLTVFCPAHSNECAIRGMCTNACGALDSRRFYEGEEGP